MPSRSAGVRRAWPARVAAIVAAMLLVTSALDAQRSRGRFGGPRYAVLDDFDGSFQFCRVVFNGVQGGDGGDWSVDWPRADENLSIRLSELTKTPVSMDERDNPKPLLVNLKDPVFFRCPFIMMTEVGNIFLDETEAKHLREYLQKGGFLWADDFWGEYAWQVWESQIRKVLPSGPYPFVDLPIEHPIFNSMFTITRFPQIPSIGAWGGRAGNTSERIDSKVPHARAIVDERGRIMALITHNTDFGDSFEREGDNHQYFIEFSVPGYAFGINALVYSMTH
ncbi:MAG: hypothetical protein A3H97_12270 [Acidobacteria bacterium RIFCSPLOWO2_02_FULL_65_29]|nr:MAG: hypothetical protein A3H97_12270 [Acidobacteria bacterium RIFCSPLOWO2_02_FULL_65_29]